MSIGAPASSLTVPLCGAGQYVTLSSGARNISRAAASHGTIRGAPKRFSSLNLTITRVGS